MVAFTAGAVLTAANLNTAFNALTFRAVTGTSDTFVLADNGGAVSYSNASPITATVPPFSAVAYANGTVIQLLNLGAGVVTVTAGAGVTLNGSSLTLAQNTGGTLIKTATNTWYFLPSSTGSGMDLITPTSVAGSGVTLSGGVVTFAAASSISVNGCFTSAYDNYLVVLRNTPTGTQYYQLRLRAASTDTTTGYTGAFIYSNNGSGPSAATGNTFQITANSANDSASSLNFYSPQQAKKTLVSALSPVDSGDQLWFNGSQNGTTQFDGFTLIANANAASGTLRIYGLRNS